MNAVKNPDRLLSLQTWPAMASIIIVKVLLSYLIFSGSNVFLVVGTLLPSWQTVVPDVSFVKSLTQWRVSSQMSYGKKNEELGAYVNISGIVPGDLLTDLMRAGLIGDPYFDRNFLTEKHIYMGPRRNASGRERTITWIYSTRFTLPRSTAHLNTTYFIVAESIKMGARVEVNGVPIGIASNQFRRYLFPILPDALKASSDPDSKVINPFEHELRIVFDPEIDTYGRFMACSGGWDWAPYTQSVDSRGSRIMSLGIPGDVYLVAVRHAMITDVVPQIHYLGDFPTEALWNGPQGDFVVSLKVYVHLLDASIKSAHQIVAQAETLTESAVVPLSEHDGEKVTINLTFSKDDIELWWPNEMGSQRMYWLDISMDDGTCYKVGKCGTIRKFIGFRSVALVTANDSNPEVLDDMKAHSRRGSALHGMYFRINGAILWARGANVVPMDQLEGRLSDEGYTELVRSAARAGMNMLRVWGGGSVPPWSFYRACDEHGILIYHDLMFVEEGLHGVVKVQGVREEINHTIRKLSDHPSIVLWNGCNECSGRASDMELYESLVMTTVASEDGSRPIWASSPSPYGWRSGVRMLDGKPNHQRLAVRPWNKKNTASIETHGPYQRGFSIAYPAVNGRRSPIADETLVPPIIPAYSESGAGYRSTFISEFGATSYSSFESMSATLKDSSWSVHGGTTADSCESVFENENTCVGNNPMAERNYPCDNRIELYFGNKTSTNGTGTASFRRQLYECMITQALWMKGKLEEMRASNSFGILIWQLNENWPTGGWGCVEYGPRKGMKGQVVGGRWKPLMYLLSRRLFRERIVACGGNGHCFARADSFNASVMQVSMEAWTLGQDKPLRTFVWQAPHGPGRSTTFFQLPIGFQEDADVVLLEMPSHSTDELLVRTDAFLWRTPRELSRLDLAISINIRLTVSAESDIVYLSLTSDRLALYVFLTTAAPGHFSDNAFHLRPYLPTRVSFDKLPSDESINITLFASSLALEHLGSTRSLIVEQVTKGTASSTAI